jgi:hypothetical protein
MLEYFKKLIWHDNSWRFHVLFGVSWCGTRRRWNFLNPSFSRRILRDVAFETLRYLHNILQRGTNYLWNTNWAIVHAWISIQNGKLSSPRECRLIFVSLLRTTLIHEIFSAWPESLGLYRRISETLKSLRYSRAAVLTGAWHSFWWFREKVWMSMQFRKPSGRQLFYGSIEISCEIVAQFAESMTDRMTFFWDEIKEHDQFCLVILLDSNSMHGFF